MNTTHYRYLTTADAPWQHGDQYSNDGGKTWNDIDAIWGRCTSLDAYLTASWTTAPYRARRPIPAPAPAQVWIRSEERKPTEADCPILYRSALPEYKDKYNIIIVHACPTTCHPYLWTPFHEPAYPAPTQADLDRKAAEAYSMIKHPYRTLHDVCRDVRGWHRSWPRKPRCLTLSP